MDQKTDILLELMISITDYSVANSFIDLYQNNNLPVSLITHGKGAATSEIFDILGFGESKKTIILSVLSERKSKHVFKLLNSKMNLNKPGRGIAFTIPINSISNILSKICISSDQDMKSVVEEETMVQKNAYDLIITIVNTGYFDQVMDAAKSAGATGGTLIHGRGLGSKEAAKFLGITIQPEKDIVLILTPHEYRQKIMETITHEVGLSTPGKGICFSMPVNATLGLETTI